MQVGDRVYLIDPHGGLTPNENWPIKGSTYESKGTIVSFNEEGSRYNIKWDNGYTLNTIPEHCLQKIEESVYIKNKEKLKV